MYWQPDSLAYLLPTTYYLLPTTYYLSPYPLAAPRGRLGSAKDQEQPQEQIQNNTALRVIREKSQDESQTQTPSLQVIFHNS